MYIACKRETEYWPVFILFLINILDYGALPIAHDATTGELLPELRCGMDVLVILVLGELFGDGLTYVVGRVMKRYYPEYAVDIPVVRLPNVVQVFMMWLLVGTLSLGGIVGAGGLVESLKKK